MEAIGGMRNPSLSIRRLPGYRERGRIVKAFLDKAQELWPSLREPARAILTQEEPRDFPKEVVEQLRSTMLTTLWEKPTTRPRTARAPTPLRSEVIAGWTEDPDSHILAGWLDHGAPMGFLDEIQTTGIFPKVDKTKAWTEAEQVQTKIWKAGPTTRTTRRRKKKTENCRCSSRTTLNANSVTSSRHWKRWRKSWEGSQS